MMTAHMQPRSEKALWPEILVQAEALARAEPLLAGLVRHTVIEAGSLSQAVARLLSGKLSCTHTSESDLRALFSEFVLRSPELEEIIAADLHSVLKNDPAAEDAVTSILFFKGFHALQAYRLTNDLWQQGRRDLARFIQNRVSELFGVDIHPAAKIGRGIMFDHATGIVIGETAIVEDDVLFWHGVTLGGTGKKGGDRHPKVRAGAQLGASCTIIGNIEIGKDAKVAAGSVVVRPVPAGVTVAGVPAKTVSP